jgi:hypothetical protein
MAQSFLTPVDLQYPRLETTIETGEDPGEVDPLEAAQGAGGRSLPPELQAVVDEILERLQEAEEE